MKVLFIASECAPIAKVGGLADVVGSLPQALKKEQVDVAVAIPFYGTIKRDKDLKLFKGNFSLNFGGQKELFDLWQTSINGFPLFLIKNDKFFSGDIYFEKDASPGGSEKEAALFSFLSAAGIKVAKFLDVDILHCHDWHTALAPYLIKKSRINIKTVLTIHNLAYQGIYPSKIINRCLNANLSGEANCLKLGILNADFITTVSPSYAKEILTKEFGCGLEEILKKRGNSLSGILNGLNLQEFDPAGDPYLKENYSIRNLEKKIGNKTLLQKAYFKIIDPQIPILGMISRLAEQKNIGLIKKIFPLLMKENLQFILLGAGAQEYENFFREKTKQFPTKFFAQLDFNEKLAHQIYAGADFFLMPSRFEPCGLGQQIAMHYGTIPVARTVGGIKDTVKNIQIKNEETQGTGILFQKSDAQEFLKAIKKALTVFQNKKILKQIQVNGMKHDFSWKKSAQIYVSLYKKLIR